MYQKAVTKQQMEQRGWAFDPPRECQRCGAMVYWGENAQSGKRASFDVNSTTYHLKTCTNSAAAPNGTYAPATRSQPQPCPSQSSTSSPAPSSQGMPEEAAHTLLESLCDLSTAVRANTAAVMALLQARARTAPTPAARRFDDDGCPTDEHRWLPRQPKPDIKEL